MYDVVDGSTIVDRWPAFRIARHRRAKYREIFDSSDCQSMAEKRRSSGMSLLTRVLECLELQSFVKADPKTGQEMLKPDHCIEDEASNIPPISTIRKYWKIKTLEDWRRIVDEEVDYFFSRPAIIQELQNAAPWFYERGHFRKLLSLMKHLQSVQDDYMACTRYSDDDEEEEEGCKDEDDEEEGDEVDEMKKMLVRMSVKEKYDHRRTNKRMVNAVKREIIELEEDGATEWWKEMTWAEARKPGTDLPNRPRQFVTGPSTSKCPCCNKRNK